MQTRERHHVDGQFAKISVQLTGETKTSGDTGHGQGHEMVQVTVGGGGELQCAEADVVQSLVIDTKGLVGILDELMYGKGGIVGFHHGVRHLGGRNNGVGVHDAIGVLFADLRDEQCAQTRSAYSCSSSSSSNSPSSSAVASWYCWYSLTRSFMLDSASVNSISSMPSPVYQCKKALRRNMAISVQLTGETKTSGDTGHGQGHEMVQVTVCGGGELQCAEADVVQSLVIDTKGLVGILDELMYGKGGIVGFHHGVGHLGGRNNGVGVHDAIGVLFADLRDEQCAQTRSGSTTQ
ncbi:hypothetical protein TCAL_16600 [Tigriopus californicus]|uniref:Uncharacterized protein n=1 Tax=Tigriopus californicus TaxID=6832 RepID=A0A553NDM0_TIGCA|nr:hypothetical protein TCAL_16600 [Tigriopus californicus]